MAIATDIADVIFFLQGYLSFWNDNISYALRGCIVIELAFRGRVSMQKDPSRRRFPLPDRIIEVIDDTLTGEVLLDEALKLMKSSEKMSVSSWIDLLSGTHDRPHPASISLETPPTSKDTQAHTTLNIHRIF
jgi:hypothetical protein